MLLSSRKKHSHLLPDSLIGGRPPKKIKPFSLQKHHIVITGGWGGRRKSGCGAPTKGNNQSLIFACKMRSPVEETCNHWGNRVGSDSLGSLHLFIIWTPDKIQMFRARSAAPECFLLGFFYLLKPECQTDSFSAFWFSYNSQKISQSGLSNFLLSPVSETA